MVDYNIKKLVFHKNRAYNSYSRDKNNTELFNKFQWLQVHIKISTEESEYNFYSFFDKSICADDFFTELTKCYL